MANILYLTRNGLLEPLGQSQVLSYLRGLSQDHHITLITFEKADDWADTPGLAKQRTECERLGIHWLPQIFRSHPKVIAPALSMVSMLWLTYRLLRRKRVSLIHARSYIPSAVALVASRLTGVPFIFDMRALWPEELITAKRLRRGSILHRVILIIERACLRYASGVVSLTYAAAEYLKREYPAELVQQTVVVIPTCADLERFKPGNVRPSERVVGCLGTVLSGWFRTDWLALFLEVVVKRDPNLRFELTTRDDPVKVRASIGGDVDLQSRLKIEPSPPGKVHEVLHRQIASVMFFTQGLGKLGSSPTRMAEILGCGLPIVANEGVGDVAQIIRKYRVGVLVGGLSEVEMNAAFDELEELFRDPELSLRCRKAAEAVFSLKAGTEAYVKLYSRILTRDLGSMTSPQ